MKGPSIFAFTDCRDPNTLTRLNARLTALFEDSQIFSAGIEVDIEAAGCILDTLDALRLNNRPSIIIGNLAPRSEKHYKNGAPFYIAKTGSVILIATKTCFSLLFKFGLIETIKETDVETVCRYFLPEDEVMRISNSQFRSFEYVPLLAKWVYEGKDIPGVDDRPQTQIENQIWWIDNFGNAKTTITEAEIRDRITDGKISFSINKKSYTLPFFEHLADVPKGEKAIIIGSSGYKNTRFAEIVIQGVSAQKEFGLSVGDLIA